MRSFALGLAAALVAVVPSFANASDLETLRDRVAAQFIGNICDTNVCDQAADLIASQLANGSFPGINYHDTSRNVWDPANHWNNMAVMTASLHCNCSATGSGAIASYPPTAEVVSSVHLASKFWFDNQAWIKSENWWWMDLGLGMAVARTLAVFRDFITPWEVANSTQIFLNADWQHGNPSTWSGENNQWGQEIEMWRGCISENVTAVDEALGAMWSTLKIIDADANPDNGIHADGSFHQHGPLLQTGTYGAAFTGDILQLLPLVTGLQWDLTVGARQALIFYALEGQRPTVRWNGLSGDSAAAWWDVSVKGREITRPPAGSCEFSSSWAATLPLLAPSGQPRHEEVVAWVGSFSGASGQQLAIAKYFWLSDYLTVATEDFAVSVRTHSTRTFTSECVNDENLQGWHQSAGFVSVRRSGDEFSRRDSIFPVWNYTLLPGVTARQVADETECNTVKQMGLTSFVGGVADGVAGTSTYDERSNDFGGVGEASALTARKVHLVGDFGLAVLVHNGSLPTGQPVATTLTSAMAPDTSAPDGLQPTVSTTTAGAGAVPQGEATYPASTVQWVASDGVVYAPLPVSPCGSRTLDAGPETFQFAMHTVNGAVNGSWQRISTSQSPAPLTRDIFTAFLAHGAINETPLGFAYLALPGNVSAGEAASAVEAAQAATVATVCTQQGYAGVGDVHTIKHTSPATGLVTIAATAFPGDAATLGRGADKGAPAGVAGAVTGVTGITRPSTWLVRETAQGLVVSVADPANTPGGMRVNATVTGVSASGGALQLVGATAPDNYDGVVSASEWAGAGGRCEPGSAGTVVTVVLPGGPNMAGAGVTITCDIEARL